MALNAADLVNAGRQVDLARLPLWTGQKDSFTAEQWLERIDRARAAADWNPATTMSFVFNALRGKALIWYNALASWDFNKNDFASFSTAFLRTYGTTKTVRTAALQLSDVKQTSGETAVEYYARVIQIIDDIQSMAPDPLPVPAVTWSNDMQTAAGFAAIDAAFKRAQIQHFLKAGAQDAYRRLGMQIFIAGLKPILRTELMKANPQSMREAFDSVVDAERMLAEPHRSGGQRAQLCPIDGEDETDFDGNGAEMGAEDDADAAELAAINMKQKQLRKKMANKKKKAANGHRGQKGSQNSKKEATPNGAGGRDDRPKCRYCNSTAHMQAQCDQRKAAGAPLVDQYGRPFQQGGVHEVTGGMQRMYTLNAPPPQNGQYQQSENGGGVGAIWSVPPPQQDKNLPYLNY